MLRHWPSMRTSGKASNICDVEMMQDAVALCRLHDKEHAQVIISTPMMPAYPRPHLSAGHVRSH